MWAQINGIKLCLPLAAALPKTYEGDLVLHKWNSKRRRHRSPKAKNSSSGATSEGWHHHWNDAVTTSLGGSVTHGATSASFSDVSIGKRRQERCLLGMQGGLLCSGAPSSPKTVQKRRFSIPKWRVTAAHQRRRCGLQRRSQNHHR